MNRRNFLKTGINVGVLGACGVAEHGVSATRPLQPSAPTPAEIAGPFYPLVAQKDTDFDLTKLAGRSKSALGRHIFIEGRVSDVSGQPIEGATVELWQANAAGKYAHSRDANPAPVDENFQGWAIVPSGKQGGFRFKSVFPGVYPVGAGWSRPPHIHFKVTKNGYRELITQMYFPQHPLNQLDKLLQRKAPEEQALMVAQVSPEDPDTFSYRIVLAQS